jgi:hypothetical protein
VHSSVDMKVQLQWQQRWTCVRSLNNLLYATRVHQIIFLRPLAIQFEYS